MFSSMGWTQQDADALFAHPMVGQHSLQTDYGEVSVNVSIASLLDAPSIDTNLTSVTYHSLTASDIILMYHDKLEFCTTGCRTKKAAGPPYIFIDVYNGVLSGRAFRNIPLHLEAECSNCIQGQIEKVLQDFIIQSFGITLEYLQIPVYEVCQDVPAFLRHYHNGDSNYTSGISITRQEYDSTHMNLTNASLSTAIDYLEAHTNVLLEFDPDCGYYSRVYSKPFRIQLAGATDEILADFAQNHFVKIEQIPGVYYDALIIKDIP